MSITFLQGPRKKFSLIQLYEQANNAVVLRQPQTLASLAFQSELNTSDCPRSLQAFNAKLAQLLGLSSHWGSQPLQHEDRHCSINPFIKHNYTTYVEAIGSILARKLDPDTAGHISWALPGNFPYVLCLKERLEPLAQGLAHSRTPRIIV